MHFGKFCYRVNCCSWTIELATHDHRAERYILDLTADCWNVRFTPFVVVGVEIKPICFLKRLHRYLILNVGLTCGIDRIGCAAIGFYAIRPHINKMQLCSLLHFLIFRGTPFHLSGVGLAKGFLHLAVSLKNQPMPLQYADPPPKDR